MLHDSMAAMYLATRARSLLAQVEGPEGLARDPEAGSTVRCNMATRAAEGEGARAGTSELLSEGEEGEDEASPAAERQARSAGS